MNRVRFVVPANSRLKRDVQIEEARRILFGPSRGLPGERWWARPLVAREMLHWYFPNKFGLPDFRLSDYYEMQAERFGPKKVPEWISMFNEIKSGIDKIDSNVLEKILRDNNTEAAMDLKAMMSMERIGEDSHVGESENRNSHIGESKRIRFVDPLFRRRRLKWMERFLAGMNGPKEIKYNRHFTRRPDEQERWPTNLGSVTVRWPNRRN